MRRGRERKRDRGREGGKERGRGRKGVPACPYKMPQGFANKRATTICDLNSFEA